MKSPNRLDSALAENLQHLDAAPTYPQDDSLETHREAFFIIRIPYYGRRRAEKGIARGLARITLHQFGPEAKVMRLDNSEVEPPK